MLSPSLSAQNVATPTIPFDPTNPIKAVRRILLTFQWEVIGVRLNRTVWWCQERYFLLLQAKLANSYPVTTSEKLIFQYSTLNIGQTNNPAASATTATTATAGAKSKPNRDAVSFKPQAQADLVPSSGEIQTQDNSPHTTTNVNVAGSTVPTNTATGVKRKKKHDTTSSNTKQPKMSHPDNSQLYPFETHPLVPRTSQSGITNTANVNLSTSASFTEPTRNTVPSNHAFSTSFHNMHSNNSTSSSTVSVPVVNNSNSTSLTMGIMASIPTMAEYEISSNNDSNDG